MAEFSIDQSSLPAVNAVCRQFAVREDHSLAHNLQEQEIEHHLASNVQRNRLVQNDLQVAKKLQEEENKKAQMRLQRRQREMELRDNQMAQVIQDELALENEKRRRQEEKDEAIARKLQEKEEKLRRKHQVLDREPLDAAFEGNRGLKPRMEYGVKEAMHGISRMSTKDLELKDAELARKLQEEEIRATQSSERAAQLAQDEEIARLLMEEEKKQVLRKSKEKDSSRRTEEERRKGSLDWRKLELERKHNGGEYVRARPQDELEPLTGKPERPARLPAQRVGSEDLDHRPGSQRPSRPVSRPSESSQKVSYYRQ
ncbi:coiled-coil domain-containing protein 50 isoform X2 [Pristis pectinata]|uniref:coiled-coil domain-containing protein 50 isoform X2 n=1 Tax=Pristis pectinata TaxID=685728 RepID=UPI00223D59A5|nr:coiled-coil domain-containing protein 50 isoform X2 [Pristis pectinata]